MQTVHRLAFGLAVAVAVVGLLVAVADALDLFGLGPATLGWHALSALLVVLATAVALAIHMHLPGMALWTAVAAYVAATLILVGGVGAMHAPFGVPLLLVAAFLEYGAREGASVPAQDAEDPAVDEATLRG
jgi:hypothetical protein